MKSSDIRVLQALIATAVCICLNSCSSLPLHEEGLFLGKDTTASVDDVGVGKVNMGKGRVTRQF